MALGKNLKRTKLIPDSPEKEKTVSSKKPSQNKKSKTKKIAGQTAQKKTGSKAKTIQPANKKNPVKKASVTQHTSAKSDIKNIPQVRKTKKLTEKERLQREERRAGYNKELLELRHQNTSWIIFEIGTELFGIDISKTQRVIPTPAISSLPHTESHITGVGQVRKHPVIFIDFSKKFELKRAVDQDYNYPYALVVKSEADLVGILLDRVPQTLKVPGNKLISIPETANLIAKKESFIKFMYKLDQKIVYMLDVEGLIRADQGLQYIQSKSTLPA